MSDDWYFPQMVDDAESPEKYRPGGMHPVDIGDILGERYKIMHKLGNGGFSTVWLVRDLQAQTPRYFSLKVHGAGQNSRRQISEPDVLKVLHAAPAHAAQAHIPKILDTFTVVGPNGTHTVLVMPLYGPSLRTMMRWRGTQGGGFGWLRPAVARQLAYQLTLTVSYIHARGFAHGDLTISNILLQLRDNALDGMSEESLYARFPVPWHCNVTPNPLNPNAALLVHAPKFIYEEVDLAGSSRSLLAPRLAVVDFGEAFEWHKPPSGGLGTPIYFCPPETLLSPESECVGRATDLWALGRCLFAIRTSSTLFDCGSHFSHGFWPPDGVLSGMETCLGQLPDELRQKWRDMTERPDYVSFMEWRLREEPQEVREKWRDTHPAFKPPASYDDETLEGMLEDFPYDAGPVKPPPYGDVWQDPPENISAAEIDAMLAVVQKLLRYNHEERVAAEKLCDEPWFTGSF
ncbi:kinase-like domain-containing protein [Geopyxis carbonaria]|nr:kinase-like domain-containing protein [Geopyxis carbonaria]